MALFQNLTQPNVYLSHEQFREKRGAWAIIPIIEEVYRDLTDDKTKFVVLLEANTHVNLSVLLKYLSQEDHQKVRNIVCDIDRKLNFNLFFTLLLQEQYFGYPIYDKEATITHHFSFFQNPSQFKYPLLSAGVVFTVSLWKRWVLVNYNMNFG